MGCRDDRSEPRYQAMELARKEQELQRFIDFLDIYDSEKPVILKRDERKIDALTRHVCERMKGMSRNAIGVLPLVKNPVASLLSNWWTEHQEVDRAREEREAKEAKRLKAFESAMAKLTQEEREALGK